MTTVLASVFILSASLIQPSYAQFVTDRRERSPGRIIAGAIVAVIFAFFLLCLCLMMGRRRRARQLTSAGAPGISPPKPLFGSGPWGRSSAGYNIQHTPLGPYPGQGPHYYDPQPPWQAPYNPEYPRAGDPAPPPMYGQDAEYGRQFSPPPGPPPGQSNEQSPYAPPPGPPPPAHTTGKDNQFFGGFRP